MKWDMQKIDYFLKVAETLNFRKAAEELFVSTQTINKQIHELENSLGKKLFEGTTRQIELTKFGKVFYDAFRPVRDDYIEAVKKVKTYLEDEQKNINILFFQPIPKAAVISEVTNCLLHEDANIHIHLDAGEIDDIYPRLLNGEADLVMTNKHDYEKWDKDIEIITLAQFPSQIVVSLLHPWAARESVTIEDMESNPVLLLQREKLDEDGFYYKLQASERHYAPDFSTLFAYLNLGKEYAVFPPLFENAQTSNFKFIDLPKELTFNFEMVCAYRKDNPHAKLFDSLKAYFEESPVILK